MKNTKMIISIIFCFAVVFWVFSCTKKKPSFPVATATGTVVIDWYKIGEASLPSSISNWTCLTGSGDTLYLAYKDLTDNIAKAIQWNGTVWISLGNISASSVGQIASCMYENVPYVAFNDSVTGKLSVKKYENGVWSYVGTQDFSPTSTFIWTRSIFIRNGNIYLAYSGGGLNVMRYTALGGWATFGSQITASNCWYTTIAVDSVTENPVVAYQNSSYGLNAVIYNGSEWTDINAGLSSGTCEYINVDYNPIDLSYYVIYKETGVSGKGWVKKLSGTTWSDVGIQPFSVGGAEGAMFAFDSSYVYVAFTDNNKSDKETVYRYNGETWSCVGMAGFTDNGAGWNNIHVNNGSIYIALRDTTTGKIQVWKHNPI